MPTEPSPAAADDDVLEVDLKDPRIAAFLAWLIPGAGHFYQGRNGKGLLFFITIVGTFVYGLYIGQGRVVYASDVSPIAPGGVSRQFFERWQYVCQLPVGLPALPAIIQTVRGNDPLGGYDFNLLGREFSPMRPPRMPKDQFGPFTSVDAAGHTVHHPNELAKWQYDLGDMFEIGTVFTVVAGLLNVLAIYDAHGGPLVIVADDDKKKPDKDKDKEKTAT